MYCHYYLEKNLVVDYVSQNGRIGKLIINKEHKKNSYDVLKIRDIGFEKYKDNLVSENSKKKIIFENNIWSSDRRRKKYSKNLVKQFPEINRFLKVYEVINIIADR
jgi:glyceraldehyde-3-phosphate dehydrogenase/erythrose-4-phosphate dehydrogenase